MKDWNERLLESTRGRVIQILRRGESTVNELAAALSLTDNAVRAHLTSLERDGLIWQSGKRPGIRKPEVIFALTDQAELLFPKAYHTLLSLLLDELTEQLPVEVIEELLRKVGRRLASISKMPNSNIEQRLEQALDVMKHLGGLAEIQKEENRYLICGFSCPLSSVVKKHPQICQLAEALLSEVIEAPVKNVCDRGKNPKCVFEVG